MIEARPASTSGTGATERWLLPTVSLIALVAGMSMWLERHLGFGLRSPEWLIGVSAALTSAAGLVDYLFSKHERAQLRDGLQTRIAKAARRLRRPARIVLAAPMQIVLYVVCLGVVASFSSIVVVPAGVTGKAEAKLCPTDAACIEEQGEGDATSAGKAGDPKEGEQSRTVEAGKKPVRFFVSTSPFGRTYRLRMDGFLPATFDVFPVLGRTIRPDRDLQPSPSVLFRPGWEALGTLEGGGRFVVCDRNRERLVRVEQQRASFLVGHPQPLPDESLGLWGLELSSDPRISPNIRAQTLLDWNHPVHRPPEAELVPEMRLIAEVISRIDVVVASTELRLGRERLIDAPLTAVPPPAGGKPARESFCEPSPEGAS